MNNFLKGTYNIKKEISEDITDNLSIEGKFREKAIASIGGSMVFVERKILIWDGGEKEK